MGFNLIITERAQEQIDSIIEYVMLRLSNPLAASAILDDIDYAYDMLERTANSFGLSNDPYLAAKGYHTLILKKHDYVILYRIDGENVIISGVFHMLENYKERF